MDARTDDIFSGMDEMWFIGVHAEEGTEVLFMTNEHEPDDHVLPLFKSRFDGEEYLNNWIGDGTMEDEGYEVIGSEDPTDLVPLLAGVKDVCTHVAVNPPLDRRYFTLVKVEDFLEHFKERFLYEGEIDRDTG